MATPTYVALATTTLSSAASSVTFGSIPSGYRDLVVIFSGQSSAIDNPSLRFNSDTGTNYSRVTMTGYSGGTESASQSSQTYIRLNTMAANAQADFIAQIMDYSATDKHKTVLGRQNDATRDEVNATAGRWADTSAITSITFILSNLGSDFKSGSTFSLYGIEA